jgi:predicted NBD/HSP70 family sugar kinase
VTLGLELLDHGAIAVQVGDAGPSAARAEERGSAAEAAVRALDKAGAAGAGAAAVAAWNPDAPAVRATIDAIRARFPGLTVHEAVASGTAAAVAESRLGAAASCRDVVYFGAADHPIAGVVHDGEPAKGGRRRGIAVAWLALNPVEREDYRKVGCLDAEVAAAGIVRRLVWRVKAGDSSRVTDLVGGEMAAITIDHVLDAARGGDGVAVSVIRDTAKYLGMAAANLVVLADPEVLVLGGIIASASDLLFDTVRHELGRRIPAATMQSLRVAAATLGADAPAIGAAQLAPAVL